MRGYRAKQCAVHTSFAGLNLFLPSTDSAIHPGPSPTYFGPNTVPKRLDFVAVPSHMRDGCALQSWVEHETDLRLKQPDHAAVVVRFAYTSDVSHTVSRPRSQLQYARPPAATHVHPPCAPAAEQADLLAAYQDLLLTTERGPDFANSLHAAASDRILCAQREREREREVAGFNTEHVK